MRGNAMNRRLHGRIATKLAACLILAGQTFANVPETAGVSAKEMATYELQYACRIIHTLENDLRLHISEPQLLADGYAWLTNGIESVRIDLNAVDMPDEVETLKVSLIALMDMLPPIAKAAQMGDMETATERYKTCREAISPYSVAVNAFITSLVDEVVTSVPIGQPTPDTDWMPDEATRGAYERALAAMDARRYQEAADLLLPLLPVVKDTPAEGIVLHRVLECHTLHSSPLSEEGHNLRMLELLQDHMARCVYSPQLPRLYFYWQTLHQMTMNGYSNYSTIDYALYNRVFRQCVDVVTERIRSQPDDIETRVTMWWLLNIPPIERFPANYHFGNSVALHHARLSRFFEDEDALDEGGE